MNGILEAWQIGDIILFGLIMCFGILIVYLYAEIVKLKINLKELKDK